MLSTLIAQICRQLVNLPEKLKDLYQKCMNGLQRASVQELMMALSWIVNGFEDVFIVIDALDECPKSGEREELLELIREIKSWLPSNLHLLATSRQEPDIKEALMPLLTSPEIPIQGPGVESDIKLHITHQLATDSKLKKWSGVLKVEIENTLVTGANGM